MDSAWESWALLNMRGRQVDVLGATDLKIEKLSSLKAAYNAAAAFIATRRKLKTRDSVNHMENLRPQ